MTITYALANDYASLRNTWKEIHVLTSLIRKENHHPLEFTNSYPSPISTTKQCFRTEDHHPLEYTNSYPSPFSTTTQCFSMLIAYKDFKAPGPQQSSKTVLVRVSEQKEEEKTAQEEVDHHLRKIFRSVENLSNYIKRYLCKIHICTNPYQTWLETSARDWLIENSLHIRSPKIFLGLKLWI